MLGVHTSAACGHVKSGAVYVEGRRETDPQRLVSAGSVVTVVVGEGERRPTDAIGERGPLLVLSESEDLLVVNKPAGVATQPTAMRLGDSLLDLVSAHLGSPAGLIHRLDRDTSGVVVFGKTKAGTSRAAAAFREGRVRKRYLAITTAGFPEHGETDLPISRDPSRRGRWRASRAANGVPAKTRYRRLASGSYDLVELAPETGRTHQLRAHLTALGFPLVGDALYGGSPGPRCLLHAWSLAFDGHHFHAPLPDDFGPFLPAGFAMESPSPPA